MAIRFACPSCQSNMKATDDKAGAKATCPKCGSRLEVPRREIVGGPLSNELAAKPVSVLPVPLAAPPVVYHAPAPFEPAGHPEPEPAVVYHEHLHLHRSGDKPNAPGVISLVFGVLSVVCTLMGCFTCGLTYYAAVPFALLGGVVGFFGAGNMRVAGLLLNGIAIIPAVVLLAAFTGLVSIAALAPKAGPGTSPADPEQWVDASKSAVRPGETRLQVTSVEVAPVKVVGLVEYTTKQRHLIVRLKLDNLSRTRKLDFAGWGEGLQLVDNHGNRYRQVTFGLTERAEGQILGEAIHPGKAVTDVLVFEAPVDGAEWLRMELPAAKVGGTGKARFMLPRAMIQR